MRSSLFASAAAGLFMIAAQGAQAQPSYSAGDILNHFAPAPALGATRGLCIGTESECSAGTPKTKQTASFDLLVNFDLNSDSLTPAARANLAEFAKALKDPRLSRASFVVEGHTDGKGGDGYNQSLSERRAKAVVIFLREQGVDTSKLDARGLGKAKPRVSDPLDPVNRRVETRLRVE